MRSQTKEHAEISAADGLSGGAVQLATGIFRSDALPNDRILSVEAGPFCKASESQ